MAKGLTIAVKRIYAPPEKVDGARFLVDRLWPRGVSKEKAALTAWLKILSPTDAMREAPKALYAQSRLRIIDAKDGIQDYAEIRHRAYNGDRGMAILMGIICTVLLAITAAGIVGLTSFWVGQRRKQIGVRRALGARQRDILAYFLTENFLISAAGVALGAVLAVAFNLWTVTRFEMDRMSMAYVGIGVIVLLLLGQGAVLAPALRASRVPPVEATRSV